MKLDTTKWVRWLAVLLLGLGCLGGMLGLAQGEQRPTDSRAQSAQVAEAQRLSQQALQLYGEGQYHAALPLLQRALTIVEQALGPEHPNVASSLHNLARLYQDTGAYDRAEPLFKRALTINERVLASSLHDLATLYFNMGAYDRAEPLFKRALTIFEQAPGPEHPNVASSLNNLAALYQATGAYDRAEPLFKRALTIRERVLVPEHPDVAQSLNNLAALYQATGAYDRAEPLFKRALTIRERVLVPEHPDVAQSLNNLAALYQATGAYDRAEPLFKRALTISKRVLGPEHPDVASTLSNLATLYFDMGAYDRPEPLFKRALTINERVLGPEHPDVATSLINLAALYDNMGKITHAIDLTRRSADIQEHHLAQNLATGDEARKRAYLETLTGTTYFIVSLHVQSAPKDPAARELALTTVLRRKGRVLDVIADMMQSVRRQLEPEGQALLTQWRDVVTQQATFMHRGPGALDPETYRQQLAQLEAQAESLEATLSARSAAFRTEMQSVTLMQVQGAIPEGTALVEVVRYRPSQPQVKRAERWGPPRYVAYVLRHQGKPAWVELGDAAAIEKNLTKLRRQLSDPGRVNVKRYARKLDEQVMQPIRPLLGDARHILLAPDGALHLLPFGALVDEEQRYLVERFTFTYLTTGRDLLRLPVTHPPQESPLVLANPAFDDLASASPLHVAQAEALPPARRSPDLETLRFEPLPATASEAKMLAALLPGATVLTEAAATETALKAARAPRLLHLATHGFFLPDQLMPPPSPPGLEAFSHDLSLPRENPMVRSGLALAGANARQSGAEDGLLTALEAAGLDLGGTQLVVLSACETGVGEVQNGEGVYGLRRALVIAGAKSQVMSLWQVDDEATQAFMAAYYRRLLGGEGRSAALRQVQLDFLAQPQRQHPFYWAAFIPSGAWAPLDDVAAAGPGSRASGAGGRDAP